MSFIRFPSRGLQFEGFRFEGHHAGSASTSLGMGRTAFRKDPGNSIEVVRCRKTPRWGDPCHSFNNDPEGILGNKP